MPDTPTPETLRKLLLRLLAFRWIDKGYGRFTCRSCGAACEVDYGDRNQPGSERREACTPNCPWRQAVELAALLDTAPPALTRAQAEQRLTDQALRDACSTPPDTSDDEITDMRRRLVDALFGEE